MNRDKIAAAAKRRRAKQTKLIEASASTGWVDQERAKRKQHPVITELREYFVAANVEHNRTRDTEHIHPSEMSKAQWCQRQTLYRIAGIPEDDDYEPADLFWRLASIYSTGNDIHATHQRAFWEMGKLYGVFVCLRCDHRWWAQSPAVCESCGSIHLEFGEVPIESPLHHVIGHTDGIYVDDDESMRNLEMKSIGIRSIEIEVPGIYRRWKESGMDINALWSQIKIPFPSHQKQVQIYMAILRLMGFEISETLFIYEFKANQDLKGFTVKYNEKAATKLLARATEVFEARENGTMVDRPDWASPKVNDCKECPWKERCWGAEVQAQAS